MDWMQHRFHPAFAIARAAAAAAAAAA